MRLHRYVDRKDFQYMEMDTDSAYMSLCAPLHLLVRTGMSREVFTEATKTGFLDPTVNGIGRALSRRKWLCTKVVMHGCQGSAVPTSASTTHAHLVCSRLSIKVLAWWHSI